MPPASLVQYVRATIGASSIGCVSHVGRQACRGFFNDALAGGQQSVEDAADDRR